MARVYAKQVKSSGAAGMVEPGNVDLYAQPEVENADGSISTVRSMSVGFDGAEVLIPQVTPDGRSLTPQEAIEEFQKTGRHLGKFDTPENATAYAQKLHEDYAAGAYRKRQAPSGRVYSRDLARDTRPDKAFARGIVNSPARMIQGIGALGGSRGQLISQIGDYVAGQTEPLANRIAPRGVGGLPEFAERMGEQTPAVLGGAVMGGATGGPMAAFGETALGIGVPVVGESMRAMGAGDDAALAAELGLSVLAPSAATRAIRAMGYRGPVQPGLHELSARRAARGMVPFDETGQGRWHERAADAIEQSARGVTQPGEQRTADMVLSEAAPNFERLAIQKVQSGDETFAARLGGRKMGLEAIQDDKLRAALDPDQVEPASSIRATAKSERAAARARNTALWKQLDLAGQPPAGDTYLRRAIDEITIEAGTTNKDTLPTKQIRQIEAMNGKIPWEEMQRLRSRLGAIVDSGSGPNATDVQRLRSRWAVRLREAIDETIDGDQALQNAYPEAIASHREYRTTWDRSSRAYRALEEQGDERLMVREILDGRDAIEEAKRVRAMFANSPQGLADFKALAAKDTFLPEVGGTSPKQIERRYLMRRKAMAELWTPQEIQAFDELVASGVDTAVGKAGRRGQNYSTGSATAVIPDRGFMAWARAGVNQLTGSDRMTNRVLERFLMNPTELVPIFRTWKRGNVTDAGKALLIHGMKTVARGTAYSAPGMAPDGSRNEGVK